MSLEDTLYPLLESYQALPQWVRRPLGRCYGRLPQSWRAGGSYEGFKELALAGEQWTPEQIHLYQLKQLRIVLHHAAQHCPYYQGRFAKAAFRPERLESVEDLAACPALEKKDLIEHLPEMVSR